MLDRINSFFEAIVETPIELYSEFGLQHELAFYLRSNYQDLIIRLEYPTPRIFNPFPQLIKKEIDVFITTDKGKRYVIELKMPKEDCGVPNEMYNAIKDVKFLEQLRQNDIDGCYSVLMTKRQAFWQAPRANAGIYQFFNGQNVNIQTLDLAHLPNFLHIKGGIILNNNYQGQWVNYSDVNNAHWKYYILNV
jgi:hypothetical protein